MGGPTKGQGIGYGQGFDKSIGAARVSAALHTFPIPGSCGQMMATPSSGRRWYAVQCLAHREAGATAHLRNQDFPVFLPRREKTCRHARKIETKLVSYFPGYVFVQLDLTRDMWRSVNSTYGVARLVMNGDRPAPVPNGVIESLQAACDGDGVIAWEPGLAVGDSVRILSGPFADLVGEMERLDAAGRVRVLLDIMGARISTVMPRASVISAASLA